MGQHRDRAAAPERRRPLLKRARDAACVLIGLGIAAVLGTDPAWSQGARVTVGNGVHAGELKVAINKSQVLRVDRPFSQVSIGNANIADVQPITNQTVYVLGKKTGTTSLTIFGANKQLIAVLDLVVTADADGLRSQLHELLPHEKIEVRAIGDSVILSGEVSSAPQAERAIVIATRFGGGGVVNQLRVSGSQQVMLQVRVAEVSRSVGDTLGLNPSLTIGSSKRNNFNFTSVGPSGGTALFGTGILKLGSPFYQLTQSIDALESKGLVKTLAEPNLIALSGDTASFLVGGEFPVPVAQASTSGGLAAITVEFKQFGITLAFTPTVLDDGLINLVVSPEVSALDKADSVTANGFTIPALTTRRATTTIELRDGEGFAIAGLLQNNINNAISQLPGLGQVPVLGALFRDTQFQRNETELVIIVIPHLVKPAPPQALLSPTDSFVPPSQIDGYLFGRVEAPESGFVDLREGGGLSGKYGHILR
jgi:pilus assembly protein CpaC